jgi:hypothetical protein
MDESIWEALPREFEVDIYRSLNVDLTNLSDEQAVEHYKRHGREEGRTANQIQDRDAFAALIPETASVLEIGPFCHPMKRGPNVFYADILCHEELVARAASEGFDPAGVPPIHYVLRTDNLSTIDRRFDVVFSSHNVEHQPDLVYHLQQVEKILYPAGVYFLRIPDKRYCFDHFIPESNLAEVISAHRERRLVHSLRSVIEHRALTTHNDNNRHWQNDHGDRFERLKERIEGALLEFDMSQGGYIDVHAWYFTPDSYGEIISGLWQLGFSKFQVCRIYPTRRGAIEFWAILQAGL